jgi:hypothetical protein
MLYLVYARVCLWYAVHLPVSECLYLIDITQFHGRVPYAYRIRRNTSTIGCLLLVVDLIQGLYTGVGYINIGLDNNISFAYYVRMYHLTLIKEEPYDGMFKDTAAKVVYLTWKCATTGKTYREAEWGNRFNRCTYFHCRMCDQGFDGSQMEQPWVTGKD